MKAKLTILVFSLLMLSPLKTYSQDFNLFNPGNELYLFSAYDEGANAFRYNPAVLGLGHRLNITLNAFFMNTGSVNLNDFDVSVNAGSFGLGYRRYFEYFTSIEVQSFQTESQRHYYTYSNRANVSVFSLGFGIGSKKISAGILLESLFRDYRSTPEEFRTSLPKFRLGFGLLFRPTEYLSTSFVYKNDETISTGRITTDKFTVGASIRPLKNDRLSLMTDFTISRSGAESYSGSDFFNNNLLKAGVDLKVTNGLYFNFNYTRVKTVNNNEFLTAGIRFDFPHAQLRYNHSFNNTILSRARNQAPGVYQSVDGQPFKYLASMLSLTYSLEKRKSIVPEKKKIIEITLSGSLQDYNTEDVFFGILGKGKRSIHEVITDIDYAAADPSVKGMIVKIYPLSSGRFEISAAIEELTNSFERFKAKGKTITAYFPQDAGPGEYYIATFADNIVLPPESIFFYGLSIDVMNYRQLLQKYGIELQTFYAGKYKLTFQGLLDSTTEEGKEVINRILDVVYEKMMSRIVTARNITLDDYMRDKLSQPLTGVEAERLGLIDKNGWYEDAKEIAEKNSKTKNIVRSINRSEWDNEWGEPDAIAIIGVYASIVSGESQPPPPVTLPLPFVGGSRSTGSETVVRQLEDAFSNPKVKIVILRVDSGGGSALASAEINSAIIRLKKKYKKPFYVSMGSAAASGGYYVSTSADKIFADEMTVTGSIGVFTARPNLDSLLKEQKIKVENFKRGENSDIGTFYRKLDEKEIEIIQGIIDFYYDRFISAIVEGRDISKEEAEEVAQGRVWLGTDAFNKKLVDELGGLYETISYAKKKSKLGPRYKLIYYAVPGGNTINDIVTSSVLQYMQTNLIKMLGFEEGDDGLEIKY
jgi:protease IV